MAANEAQPLTSKQEEVLRKLMIDAGINRGVAARVILEARDQMTGEVQSGPVSVHQSAHTVEAGASMIGLKADRIG